MGPGRCSRCRQHVESPRMPKNNDPFEILREMREILDRMEREGAKDREQAAKAREQAQKDREQAEKDRKVAEMDRKEAAQDRKRAAADRKDFRQLIKAILLVGDKIVERLDRIDARLEDIAQHLKVGGDGQSGRGNGQKE